MWNSSKFGERLGLKHPIVQAPMILQKPLVPLASAVCNAGGLGSLGCAEMSVNELDQRITEMKQLTDKPFNPNFFLHDQPRFDPELDKQARALVAPFYQDLGLDLPADASGTEAETFDTAKLDLLIEQAPAMVSFHFGCPDPSTISKLQTPNSKLQSAGIVVAATATTVTEAIALEQAGVEVVVAQGWEAGGHRGSFVSGYEDVGIGTLALVPQIRDAVSCFVVASGGIADGRGIVACRALGADAVWMGTAFLTCAETPISDVHHNALMNARDEDTHLSRAFSGRPCRARRTPYSTQLAQGRPELPAFPLMYNYSSPIKRHGIAEENLKHQFLLYGQAATLNKEGTAEQLIEALMKEAQDLAGALLT